MNVLSCKRNFVLEEPNHTENLWYENTQQTFAHCQKQPHNQKDTKESNRGSKNMMNKKKRVEVLIQK